MKKKHLTEEQQLNEFVGKIAAAMFTKKAEKIVKATKNNPKIYNALSQYKKDLEDFRARMKKLGVSSSEDLIAAVNKDPNIQNIEDPRDARKRIRRELGLD